MPSRFTFIAMALAAPLWLAACEQEAQQEAETGQAEEPPAAETQTAEPAEPAQPQPQPDEPPATAERQPPPTGEPGGQPAPEAQGEVAAREDQAAEGEDEIVVVPPQEDAAAGGEQQAAQGEDRRPAAQAPGEPAPEAAGVASVAAYVGRWAEEERLCRSSYWVFTNLRLVTPGDLECDIESTEEREDGVSIQLACTHEDQPLAEPERGTMSLTFPNLPQTDTMQVSGGPATEEPRTLARCPRG